MMDGRVGAIRARARARRALETAILSLLVEVRLGLLRAVPRAAHSAPASGDRKGYQIDPANGREALRESLADIDEGADMLMVKPAGPYLDVIARLRDATLAPIAAYQVSGEHAMLERRRRPARSTSARRRARAPDRDPPRRRRPSSSATSRREVAEVARRRMRRARRRAQAARGLYDEACRHIPGGVNSPVRAMRVGRAQLSALHRARAGRLGRGRRRQPLRRPASARGGR